MICTTCGDKGLVRLPWTENPEEDQFALCLCAAGMVWRNDQNAGRTTYPLWMIWAAQNQVQHDRIVRVEDVLTPDELITRGLRVAPQTAATDREAALLAAGKTRKGKL